MVEALEVRDMLATIPVTFNIPPDVASQAVFVMVAAELTKEYNSLPKHTYVFLDPMTNDYAQAQSGENFTFKLAGNGAVVDLPDTHVKSGQIVIGIGAPPTVTLTSKGISTPTASTNPYNVFGLFEYSIDDKGLDIDLSEIDQVGFPFTITTTPTANIPANEGVGISVDRQRLFELYPQYITSQGGAAAPFMQAIEDGTPYRITSPQNVPPTTTPMQVQLTDPLLPNGGLTLNTNYYYWITATHTFDPHDAPGETGPSNVVRAVPVNISTTSGLIPYATVQLAWDPFPDATGYNIYRSEGSADLSNTYLIGSTDAATLTFIDNNSSMHTKKSPPSDNYTYNELNWYFNPAIDQFFNHYQTNEFSIFRDGYTFTGKVNRGYQLETNGPMYSVLPLSTASGPYAGQTFLIFQPYFSGNTSNGDLPSAPVWMPNATQSPGQMVLAADGVFNTGGAQPGADSMVLSDLENSIVSAFNRGIANNFNIAPVNWAAEPVLKSATVVTPMGGSDVPTGTYYYVISATNSAGETTVSLERQAIVTAAGQGVMLEWDAEVGPTEYNIYRSTTQGSGYQFVKSVPNVNGQTNSATDTAMSTTSRTPYVYYAPNTMSNWYSAFLHQNSTNNPTTGVSINGLAYGFPYDDQGGASTNFQGFFTAVSINIQAWGDSPSPPAPGPGPDTLMVLTEPTGGVLNSTNSVRIEVYNQQGMPYTGGTSVIGTLVGAMEGDAYVIPIDATTGIGTLTFPNSVLGQSSMRLTLPNGKIYTTVAWRVTASEAPPSDYTEYFLRMRLSSSPAYPPL